MVGISAAAAAGLPRSAVADPGVRGQCKGMSPDRGENLVEPFLGPHQCGITTPAQTHNYTATLDLVTTKRDDLIRLRSSVWRPMFRTAAKQLACAHLA